MKNQNQRNRKNKNDLLPKVTLIIIIGLLWLSLFNPQRVRGQTTVQTWTIPTNLSHSGATTNPAIVIDNNNVIHAIWQDTHGGVYYVKNIENHWSTPVSVKFPFGNAVPRFFTNSKGQIYAFWNDNKDSLYYSNVPQNRFGEPTAWIQPQWLADSAILSDVTIDPKDQFHVVYINSQDTADYPAGIYYRQSLSKGAWSLPTALYESPYLRNLTGPMANIQISSGSSTDSTQLYVVWDNPGRKQISLVKSEDAGKTWSAPIEVDGPDLNLGSKIPFKIRTLVDQNKVLLVWQRGEFSENPLTTGTGTSRDTATNVNNCNQLFQVSSDSGKTWTKPKEMLKGLNLCVQNYQFFPFGNDLSLLMVTTTQNQVFLLAWDGSSWGEPQAQPTLSNFEDTEIFNKVKLDCRNTVRVGIEKLIVVGCDAGGGGDIWATSRSLGSVKDWYPPPPVWHSPTSIATSQTEILYPVTVAGLDERFHVFWNQFDTTNQNIQEIFYANLNKDRWSSSEAVLSSPEGKTGMQSGTLDPKGRLLVTWSGGKSRQIYFSWANAAKATNKSEWASPQVVATQAQGTASPDIITNKQGTIYIAYAIPLNEHRGIYIIQSADEGNIWSDPVEVFDAAKAGWDMLDQPQLVISPDGSLHVFWTRYTLPGGIGPLGIYEAHSEDNGKTWSTPETMVEGSVIWSQALGSDQGPLQLVWLEQNAAREVFKHQYSQDNGLTWNRTPAISNLTNIQGQPGATTDSAGRLHLLVVSLENGNNLILKHLMWDGQVWISDDNFDISQDSVFNVNSVAASITPAGQLDVVYAGAMTGKPGSSPQYSLFSVQRPIDVPKIEVFNILPTSSPIEPILTNQTPIPISTKTVIPSPTPTPDQSIRISQPQNGNSQGDNNYSGLILGAGLALLIAILFLGFRLLSIRRGKG